MLTLQGLRVQSSQGRSGAQSAALPLGWDYRAHDTSHIPSANCKPQRSRDGHLPTSPPGTKCKVGLRTQVLRPPVNGAGLQTP